MSPGLVANYVYELAKSFNHFYHELSILKENNNDQRNLRVMICMFTANIIKQAFNILGINVPDRM